MLFLRRGTAVAWVDKTEGNVPSVLGRWSADLRRQGYELKQFDELYKVYSPNDWQNRLNLALYYLAQGEQDAAKELYSAALAKPVTTRRVELAIADLDEYLELFPEHAQALEMREMLQEYLEERRSK